MTLGFNHSKSDLVDVTQHEVGEFVQVWNQRHDGSFDSPAQVVLSYFRTPMGTKDVVRRFSIAEGPFVSVEVSRAGRRLQYRDGVAFRWEADLPSGMVMVDDERATLHIREEFYELFDQINLAPIGASLGDRDILEKVNAKTVYFRLSYQELTANGEIVSVLRLVEKVLGVVVVEVWELEGGEITQHIVISRG